MFVGGYEKRATRRPPLAMSPFMAGTLIKGMEIISLQQHASAGQPGRIMPP